MTLAVFAMKGVKNLPQSERSKFRLNSQKTGLFYSEGPKRHCCAKCDNEFFEGELGYRTPYGKFYCLRHIPFDQEIAEGRLKPTVWKKK